MIHLRDDQQVAIGRPAEPRWQLLDYELFAQIAPVRSKDSTCFR